MKQFIFLLILLALSGILLYAQKGQGEKQGWKPCKDLPPITQTGPFSGTLKANPSNAPCYVDITATAEGVNSAPVRIYIKR